MVERLHKLRFYLVGRVLFRYLMVKLNMVAGSLLCALDHSELSFCREFSRMNNNKDKDNNRNIYFLFQLNIQL